MAVQPNRLTRVKGRNPAPGIKGLTDSPAKDDYVKRMFSAAMRRRTIHLLSLTPAAEHTMSMKHPIIAVTGSSGAGTTTVKHTFEAIFHRENVNAAIVEGDSFHRYTRAEMKVLIEDAEREGKRGISHFGPAANLLSELETLFRAYGEAATGRRRYYIHNEAEAMRWNLPLGTFTEWEDLPVGTDCLFYEGLHGALVTEDVNNVEEMVDKADAAVRKLGLEVGDRVAGWPADRLQGRERSRPRPPPRRTVTRTSTCSVRTNPLRARGSSRRHR